MQCLPSVFDFPDAQKLRHIAWRSEEGDTVGYHRDAESVGVVDDRPRWSRKLINRVSHCVHCLLFNEQSLPRERSPCEVNQVVRLSHVFLRLLPVTANFVSQALACLHDALVYAHSTNGNRRSLFFRILSNRRSGNLVHHFIAITSVGPADAALRFRGLVGKTELRLSMHTLGKAS